LRNVEDAEIRPLRRAADKLERLSGDGIAEARGVVAAACATLAELLKSKAPPEPPASRL
jgi:hypothetical protein